AADGEIVAAPIGMAEVTPTRVPGERQLVPKLGGWAPFLPRVDDLLATATIRRRPLRIVTALGTVTLRGPPTLRARMRARLAVSFKYPKLAASRERSLLATEPNEKRAYAEEAAAMGFSVEVGDTTGVA